MFHIWKHSKQFSHSIYGTQQAMSKGCYQSCGWSPGLNINVVQKWLVQTSYSNLCWLSPRLFFCSMGMGQLKHSYPIPGTEAIREGPCQHLHFQYSGCVWVECVYNTILGLTRRLCVGGMCVLGVHRRLCVGGTYETVTLNNSYLLTTPLLYRP